MNKETKKAIDMLGGRGRAAYIFDISYTTINQWEKRGIPPRYVPIISYFTGIPRDEIRPDIYGINVEIPQDVLDRFEAGIKIRTATTGKNKDRDNDICKMFKLGNTLQEIGDKYGFTREYARQILAKYNLVGVDGGQQMQTFANCAARARIKRAKADARCIKIWGCTKEQYDELRAMSDDYTKTPLSAYSQQKRNAGERNIPWRFTLWEWWSIWRDSGKWEKRGRYKHGYVMGRLQDVGGYEKGNVEIITLQQNSREYYVIHGSDHKKTLRG